MDTLATRVKNQPRADGVEQILMSGEPEALNEAGRSMKGIPLTPDVVESLKAEANLAGIPLDFENMTR